MENDCTRTLNSLCCSSMVPFQLFADESRIFANESKVRRGIQSDACLFLLLTFDSMVGRSEVKT